jgi:hypothetical protein
MKPIQEATAEAGSSGRALSYVAERLNERKRLIRRMLDGPADMQPMKDGKERSFLEGRLHEIHYVLGIASHLENDVRLPGGLAA